MRPIVWQTIIAVTALLIIVSGTALESISSESIAHSLFQKHGTYSRITDADAKHHQIIGFLGFGKEPDISFLSSDEQSHIQDVRDILDVFGIIYWGSVILFLFSAKMLWQADKTLLKTRLGKALLWTGVVGIALIALLAIAVLIDFNSTFELMHKLFFPQGNWQFSMESTLIRIYPEGVFQGYGTRIITTILVKLALIAGTVLTWTKLRREPRSTLMN